MTHTCNQVDRFNNLNQQLAEVKVDIADGVRAEMNSASTKLKTIVGLSAAAASK